MVAQWVKTRKKGERMKREIKFRAWNKKLKVMSTWEEILSVWGDHEVVDLIRGNETYELMQFTGLYDKLGKEIYESDIVEFIGHKNRVVGWTPDDHHYAGWYAIGGIRPLPIYSGKEPNTIEVIGNIYENPELISK